MILFRHTLRRSYGEIYKAREFVLKMPLYVLPQNELETVVCYFSNADDQDEDNDEEFGVEDKAATF